MAPDFWILMVWQCKVPGHGDRGRRCSPSIVLTVLCGAGLSLAGASRRLPGGEDAQHGALQVDQRKKGTPAGGTLWGTRMSLVWLDLMVGRSRRKGW